jgi:hypothetical protein
MRSLLGVSALDVSRWLAREQGLTLLAREQGLTLLVAERRGPVSGGRVSTRRGGRARPGSS